MNINKLASAISRGKWLIEPNIARVERQRAIKFLNRDFSASEEDFERLELEKPKAFKAGNYYDMTDDNSDIFGVAETGSVAILPICGTIMKYDYCGTPGTDTLGSWLKAAIASPQIDAIVLLINSGGGSVEGTGEFSDIIKASDKTILAFCDGMIASAAYWIGSSAKEIWASHKTVEAGSIGVAATFFDDSKAMEEAGYKDIYMNADTSPDKNMDYFDAIKGDYTGMKVNSLNPLDNIFMDTVKSNRVGKIKLTDKTINDIVYQEPLTGSVYLAETAIQNGLIDGICTLEQCIEKALEMKSNTENNNNLNLNNMAVNTEDKDKQAKKSMSFIEKLEAFFNSEKVAEDQSVVEEKAEEIEAKKADDEEETAKKIDAKKADSDEDDDDMKDDDDDSDEDDVEINGKTYSMKDAKQAKAALAAMSEAANKEIASRDALLEEANLVISENVTELKKSVEQVKKEIKSSFTLKSSSRSNKIGVNDDEGHGQAFKPTEGSYADQVLNRAMAKQKASSKSAVK